MNDTGFPAVDTVGSFFLVLAAVAIVVWLIRRR
jgi:flagellar biogenesis protein FliO